MQAVRKSSSSHCPESMARWLAGIFFLPLAHERDDGLGGGGGKGLLDVVVQAAAGGLAALVGEDGGDELVPKEVAEEVIDLVQDGGAGRAEGAANAPAPS